MVNNIVKFLVVGDLHGRIPKIRKKEFDAIICPGDICGDDIRPYITKWIKLRSKDIKNHREIDFDKICPKKKQTELRKESIKKGRAVLKHLNSIGKPVFLVPGNWDMTPYRDGLDNHDKLKKNYFEDVKKGFKNIVDIEFTKNEFNGIILIGHGSTSAPEPLIKVPREKFEDKESYDEYKTRHNFFTKIIKKLNNLFEKNKEKPIIFLTHNVPHNTKLDKVKSKGSYANNEHYGSVLARKLIEKHEPLLCIGGHIHEGYGKTKLGKTLCINSGFGGDVNTIIEIDIKKKKIKNIEWFGKNKAH